MLQVKKVQTGDVFAMKVIDRQRNRNRNRNRNRTLTPALTATPTHQVIDRQRGRSHRLATERKVPPSPSPNPNPSPKPKPNRTPNKVLFSCNSPFVVTTYFAFEDSQRLYLVMECLCSDCKHLLQERPLGIP